MKLAANIFLSLLVLGLCLFFVWPDEAERARMAVQLRSLDASFLPYVLGYVALLALTHFARAWRWRHLLAPVGISLKPGELLAVSSAGFFAILALPARLGEFVRPAALRARADVGLAEGLGTIVVERILDGLLIITIVVIALGSRLGTAVGSMSLAIALCVFAAGLGYLMFAVRAPDRAIRLTLSLSLLPRFAPRLASSLDAKLRRLFLGFAALKNRKHVSLFLAWSCLYWSANAMGIWLLAQGFGLELPVLGAFATMGIVSLGITLPNAPALAGQFHAFLVVGLSLYIGSAAEVEGLAFAVVLHGIQVIWYTSAGVLAFATPYVSFKDVVRAPKVAEDSQ